MANDRWKDYLTEEEKDILTQIGPNDRTKREIVKNCWSRHYKLQSDLRFDRKIEKGHYSKETQIEVRNMNRGLAEDLKPTIDLDGRIDRKERGEQEYSDDWKDYMKSSERDIFDTLGQYHAESVAIKFRCFGRRTYYRRKKKLSNT